MMKNVFYFLFLSVVLVSCGSSTQEDIKAIEGYWNIEEVRLPNGDEKDFPFSNHMDHFEIDGFKGVKNRVSPTYDGSMISYGSPVYFKWEEQDGKLLLQFQEDEKAYRQTVEEVTSDKLVLLHENGTEYTYEKYTPDEK